MQADKWLDNETAYDDLIVAVEASQGIMSILLAVCDDMQFREEIIQRYEAELQPKIRSYRITLLRENPSLRHALAQQIEQNPYLQEGGQAVFTVTGAEQLSFLKLGQVTSEQDIFFGYLQWTREGLREFKFPIILWVTNQLLAKLSRKAPDFWSWRKDVFRFVCKKIQTVHQEDVVELLPVLEQLDLSKITDDDEIPIQDLEKLIATIEVRQPDDPLLATLYSSLGRIYAQRIQRGEAQNYSLEVNQSIELFRKAATLQEPQKKEVELAVSLAWLGYLHKIQGRYAEAEPLYVQSLSIREQQLGVVDLDVATSLNVLATLYKDQGRYAEAEPLYVRSLSIREQQLGADHPDVASSLNNLALLYKAQGRYAEAEPLYVRSLSIREQQLGADHPDVASSLSNLGVLYYHQGRYAEAEPLYVRSLSIRDKQLGADHPDVASSLSNLGVLYYHQGRYAEAEPLYVRSLKIREEQLGTEHPDVAVSLYNLAELHETQRNYTEVEPLYIRSLAIFEKTLGADHPKTTTVREDLARLHQSKSSSSTSEFK
jgi:tetratricopeptide (TPR) repeat protein